jgi:hypothetical protein
MTQASASLDVFPMRATQRLRGAYFAFGQGTPCSGAAAPMPL